MTYFLQNLNNVTAADCNAQQAACNQTIQHTVADSTNGVVPDRVTDIVVEEEEEEEGRIAYHNGVAVYATSTKSARLKYKITVFDPELTVEKLRSRLTQAARDGSMNAGFRKYAAQFGATRLMNATLALPRVTNAAVQRDTSAQLTGVQVALLVIGVVVALAVMVTLVVVLNKKQTQSARGLDLMV